MTTSLKSQVLESLLIGALIAVLPLLSNSFRPTYIYCLFNLLIIKVGADAGLLSFFSKAADEKKSVSVATYKIFLVTSIANSPENESTDHSTTNEVGGILECDQKMSKAVAESSSEKIVGPAEAYVPKKCPSTPSLFFIGEGPEDEDAEELIAEEDGHDEDQAGKELFQKAETFIGNFYMQLKMQREDSWPQIHGLCASKAF